MKEKFLHEFYSFLFELNENTNEWYLSDFYDLSIKPLPTMISFELVSEIMSMIIELDVYKKDCFYDAIYVLNQIYQHSNTTEVPLFLSKNPDFFVKLLNQADDQNIIELVNKTANEFNSFTK